LISTFTRISPPPTLWGYFGVRPCFPFCCGSGFSKKTEQVTRFCFLSIRFNCAPKLFMTRACKQPRTR